MTSRLFLSLLSCLVLPAMLAAAPAGAEPRPAAPRVDVWPQPCPPLIGSASDWLNTGGQPLSIRADGHHVYLIDFWEYTCVNCLRTLPYLQEWNRRYAKYGLVIIGIHTPEFAFARDHANVAAAVKRLGVTWPVLVDSDYRNWNAFHNNFWPREYFVNAGGQIVADHSGEGNYDETEARIQDLLSDINPAIKFPPPMQPIRTMDRPGAVCYPTTPELYVGERGATEGQHGNLTGFQPGLTLAFIDSGSPHDDGKIYANGLWTAEPESLRHARTSADLNDYVALRYHALECNAVIKPEDGKPLKVFVTQDGMWVAPPDRGADIQTDQNGRTYLLIDSPRMYHVTRNAKFGTHELRLASKSPDFGIYSFTFSSCEQP